MKTIVWQTEYQKLVDSYCQRNTPTALRGGNIYEYLAAKALEDRYNILMDPIAPRHQQEGSLKYFLRLRTSRIAGDVFIKSPSVIMHGPNHGRAIDIGMIHHIYLQRKNSSLRGRLALKAIKNRLCRQELVITVSHFWRDYLEAIGCRDVRVIFNAFDPQDFVIPQPEIVDFRLRHQLPNHKPLVYIGYAHDGKGVEKVYRALKDADYNLIMTGPPTYTAAIPVRRLFLSRRDYLCLLHACDIVLSMSTIEEGWSRVVHEALLCKTPVIGSGSGGMGELLDGGGQLICRDIDDLPAMIEEVLVNRKLFSSKGFAFARQFNLNRFQQQWRELFNELLGS